MPGFVGSANPANLPSQAAAGDPYAVEAMRRQQMMAQAPVGDMTQSQFGNAQAISPELQARRQAALIELLRKQGR